jgi:hypothetical protein
MTACYTGTAEGALRVVRYCSALRVVRSREVGTCNFKRLKLVDACRS